MPVVTMDTSTSLAGWAFSTTRGTMTGLFMAGGPGGWGNASGVPLVAARVLLAAGHEVHAGGEEQRRELAALLPELHRELLQLLQIVRPRVQGLPGDHLG